MRWRVWTFDTLRAKYMQWYFTVGQRQGPAPHHLFTWSRKAMWPGLCIWAARHGVLGRDDLCALSWEDLETGA